MQDGVKTRYDIEQHRHPCGRHMNIQDAVNLALLRIRWGDEERTPKPDRAQKKRCANQPGQGLASQPKKDGW